VRAGFSATSLRWEPAPVALLNSLRFGSLDEPRNRYLFRGRGARDRRLWQLRRRPHARRARSIFCPRLFGQSARQRDVASAFLKEKELIKAAGARRRQHPPRCRLQHRPRWASTAHRSHPRSSPRKASSAAPRSRSAIRSPRSCCSKQSLELIASGHIVAIQDMGAAGFDVVLGGDGRARGGVGVEIDLSQVPTARAGHDAVRDSAVRIAGADARRGQDRPREDKSRRSPAKWELTATPHRQGHGRRDVSLYLAGQGCRRDSGPTARRGTHPSIIRKPQKTPRSRGFRTSTPHAARSYTPSDAPARAAGCARQIASKKWVFEQYDSTVQASTVIAPRWATRGRDPRPARGLRHRGQDRLQQAGTYASIRTRAARAAVAEAARKRRIARVHGPSASPIASISAIRSVPPVFPTNSAKRAAASPTPVAHWARP